MSNFRVIAHGLSFPEGPVCLPDGSILVTEIAAGQLTKINTSGDKILVAQLNGGPNGAAIGCLLYTSPSPRDVEESRMPCSA